MHNDPPSPSSCRSPRSRLCGGWGCLLTPALKALAERAVAAGAPEADDHTVIVIPGVSFRSVLTGLVYDRPTRLPLLSDPSWLGWTLCEVERRDYWWAMSARGAWSVTGPTHAGGDPGGRPEALVAMLEATMPGRAA